MNFLFLAYNSIANDRGFWDWFGLGDDDNDQDDKETEVQNDAFNQRGLGRVAARRITHFSAMTYIWRILRHVTFPENPEKPLTNQSAWISTVATAVFCRAE